MTHLVTHPSLFFLPFLLFSILLCLMQCNVHWFQPQMFMFICCFYCNTDTKGSWQKTDQIHTNANISPLYTLLEKPHKSFPSMYRLFILKSFFKSSFCIELILSQQLKVQVNIVKGAQVFFRLWELYGMCSELVSVHRFSLLA